MRQTRIAPASVLGILLWLSVPAATAAQSGPSPEDGRPDPRGAVIVPLRPEPPPASDPVVVTGPLFGQKKASDVLRAALRHMEGKIGEAPTVLGGLLSLDGQEGQVICRFTAGGRPIQAQVLADVRAGATVFLLDDARCFRGSYGRLIEKAQERFKELEKPADWTIQRRRLNDGSTIDLPATWQISGDHRGMISAQGPEGALDYGCATQAFPAAMRAQWGGLTEGVLYADYTTPSQIHRDLFPQIAALAQRAGAPAARFVKMNECAPIRNAVGDAEVMDYEWERLVQGQAVRWRSLALVITRNLGGSLFYYVSAVHAPAATFARDLRQHLRLWSSCRVSLETQKARLDEAAKSLKEVSKIIHEAATFQRETFDRSFANWSAGFRELVAARDNQTGAVGTGQVGGGFDFAKVADAANQGAGWKRFEVLDPKDLK